MTESKETRTLNAFAAISRIPDDYILSAEQMLFEAEAGISRPQKPMGGFRRFLNSGWGAAVISGIVALAVLAFIIHAGVNPPATYEPPVKPAGSTIEMSTEGVNYTIATELEHYPRGAVDITAVLTGKTKGESISTAGGGWHLERLTADRAEMVEIIYPCIAQMHKPPRDEYATLVCSMTALTPLPSGTYRLHSTKYDGEKYVSVAWCEFTVGSELYPPEAENSPYNLSVPNTTYGSVNITVTATAKEKGEALPAIGRGWKVVKLAGPANTGNTGITILEYGVEAVDPPDADSYATYTESLILEDPSAWLPGIYRLHDLNSQGESVAYCDFVIYEEGYVPLTTENPDHIVVPGIFLWADNTPMVVLMDYYDELYPEPNPSYAAVAVIYPILLVNDHRDGGSGMDLHSGSIVEVEIGKKITYPHHGDLYALRVVTEGTLNDVNPDWLIFLQEAGYTIRDMAEVEPEPAPPVVTPSLPFTVTLNQSLYTTRDTALSVRFRANEPGVPLSRGDCWSLYRMEDEKRIHLGSQIAEYGIEGEEVAPDEYAEEDYALSIKTATGGGYETLSAGKYELVFDVNGRAVSFEFEVADFPEDTVTRLAYYLSSGLLVFKGSTTVADPFSVDGYPISYEGLTDGDLVEIRMGNYILETWPCQIRIYAIRKISDGTIDNIPADLLEQLKENGWYHDDD